MSIFGFKMNDPIFNDPSVKQKVDLNNDGQVSFRELKKVAKIDGDKSDLSLKELESIGITDTGIQEEIIEAYKNHPSPVNILSFLAPNKQQTPDIPQQAPTPQNAEQTPDGSEIPPSYDSNAGNTVGKEKRGANWEFNAMPQSGEYEPTQDINKGAKSFRNSNLTNDSAKELFNLLGAKDKETGHYIEKLFKDNPKDAEEICKSLTTYLNSDSPDNALFPKESKNQYVKDLLHDIDYPTDINQGNRGTCAATAIQVKLAAENPKKYIEVSTELADGKKSNGVSPMPIKDSGKHGNDDNRSLSAKVVENAFMEYARPGVALDDQGLSANPLDTLQTNFFGNTIQLKNEPATFEKIDASLEKGSAVPIAVFETPNSNKGHEMLLLSNNKDGTYNVFTWGKEEVISKEDLQKYLRTAHISNN